MIVCAALEVQIEGLDHLTYIPCIRHGFGFKLLADLGYVPKTGYKVLRQGFLTNKNMFLDREEAFIYAKEIGQLPQTALWYKEDHKDIELFSEDLY